LVDPDADNVIVSDLLSPALRVVDLRCGWRYLDCRSSWTARWPAPACTSTL
jgi:hypothetical protein